MEKLLFFLKFFLEVLMEKFVWNLGHFLFGRWRWGPLIYVIRMYQWCWFNALKRLMGGKLMQFTGNHPLSKHTSGKIEVRKYQNPCGYMKLMLELVVLNQKYPHSVISQTRFSPISFVGIYNYSIMHIFDDYICNWLHWFFYCCNTFSIKKMQVLPYIKEAGYNAIQLIGIVEHKDYFTVGYRVS